MPTTFAALQTNVNASIVAKLANETMTVNSVAVDGIFGNEFVMVDYVESRKPVFTCKSADLINISNGTIAVASDSVTTYKVRSVQPDGTGLTKLVLELM